MPRSKAIPIRFTESYLRLIDALREKLGLETRAALIKYAIARLALEEKVKIGGKTKSNT